ncbi:GNAT family N-acetyltransferase [Sphingomonas sp.]|uniref:GNAT family N-acetyltransferase n=1 Tax=Sphingomonas sp. TaxID=28214 RepID=UPI001D5728DF|nr:GNAT family N-acetyltransferase [Sphingomonas sp.]MBX9795827.1 GNAT family N-acetyltransferase [Sphingomonas sp.]
MIVRPAVAGDAGAIAAIYAHHVATGTATFDTEAPGEAEWAAKIAELAARGWPFLVAADGPVLGYAYATQLRDRPGYRFACEDSIYVAAQALGHGVGSALLERLIAASTDAGFHQMIAVIGGGAAASVALHEKFGFHHVGRLHHVGHKFGTWLDTVYMQRALVEQ